MSIQWQQGAVFDGAYTYLADVGGGVTLHVWREEPGVWCWYAKRGTADYPAFHSEQSVATARAAAARWWKAHGRISTTRRVVYGHKRTFLVGTGADETPPPPALVEQPVEQLQQDGPGFSLTDPIGGPDAGAQIPVAKPANNTADALERSIGGLSASLASLERHLSEANTQRYGCEIAQRLADGQEADTRQACFWLREAIAKLEAERAALLTDKAEG